MSTTLTSRQVGREEKKKDIRPIRIRMRRIFRENKELNRRERKNRKETKKYQSE
jgi:hypothetical protein